MLNVKLIIQEPKYQINIGYIARVAKNFGIKRLYFIAPRTNIKGKKALMFAKHASELLNSATLYKDFDEATADCDLILGTTGVWQKANTGHNIALSLEEAVKKVSRLAEGRSTYKVALVLGRDDVGMSRSELEKCDIIATIPSNTQYPVLNISHALAIMLYEFSKERYKKSLEKREERRASRKEIETLLKVFNDTIKNKKIRDKKAVAKLFRNLLSKARPSEKEVHALITALK